MTALDRPPETDRAPQHGVSHPWAEPPGAGEAIEVADGVLWARLPLPMALDHVNVYALREDDGWSLVDTGLHWKAGRAALDALLAGPLGGQPVRRVVLTHHHPDHIGMAGIFADRGAELLASRVAWLTGRMMVLDPQDRPTEEQVLFRRRAGVVGPALKAYAAERPFNFADCVLPLPMGFTRLRDGDRLRLGGRDWLVRLGEGHAPEHVSLWCDGLVLSGDQIIPGISSNIGVYPSEPDADPLAGWLDSCRSCLTFAADQLVLPGHKRPFYGLGTRLEQLIDNHVHALERIERALKVAPKTAAEIFPELFRREIGGREAGLALVEAVAHLNHLHHAGRVSRKLDDQGSWRYRA